MKSKSKIIITLIAVLLCAFMAAFMSACDDKGNNSNGNDGGNSTHTHTYSAKWSYDDNYHWHAATCEHASEIDAKSEHALIDGKCSVCDYESKTEQPTTQKKTYDMSKVVFADLAVKYDGREHSITATNLPEGVTATYEGNGKTEAGTYTIIAHFTGDSKNYNPIPDKTATLTITRETHKVTFKQAGQPDIVKEVLDLAGLAQSQIPTPVEENGYNIVWEDKDLSRITTDITVNSIKTPITYSITYHLDGGTNNIGNPTNYNIEMTTITLLSATKTDYIFEGWFSDEQLQTQVTQITRGSYGDIDLYAKWTHGGTEGLIYTLALYGDRYTVTGYNGTNTKVVIPEEHNGYPVIGIGMYAFSDCTSITSITIPDSVTGIGSYAFSNCTSLTSITIPESVTSIGVLGGGNAFSGCTSLTSITIPGGVTSIGSYVFDGCTSLANVTFGKISQLTSIDSSAFSNCTSLTSIIIPDGVTSIGDSAFFNCKSLESITIPVSVASIRMYAFYNCTNLKTVYYGGTAEQWGKITINDSDYGNGHLHAANIITTDDSIGNDGNAIYKIQWANNSLLRLLPFPTFGTCTGITTTSGNAGATFTGATEANFKAYISLISGTFSTNSSLTGNNSYVAYNAAGTIRVAIGYANGNFSVLVTQI